MSMNKPNLLPKQEISELPEYIQEQMRRCQQMTPEDRSALVEKQRLRDPGEKVPFAVRERRYIMEELQKGRPKKPE